MKLPKCPCGSTVTEIWSTLVRKQGSESFGHTKSNGGSGWSKMEEGVVGNKTEVVVWSNSGKINGGGDGFWPRFFKP